MNPFLIGMLIGGIIAISIPILIAIVIFIFHL